MTPEHLVVTRTGLRYQGRRFPCATGRGGVTGNKQEGDGATPLGTHRLVQMFYRPDRIVQPASWAIPLRRGDLWSDDPDHPDYNRFARAPYPHSHEDLWRADPLYDVIITTDWNWPDAQPGKGSAIFLHSWRKPRHPTEGCVAMDIRDLVWIAGRIAPGTRMHVIG